MWWLISGCFLGALGALLKYLQLPFAVWITFFGLAAVFVGIFRWLGSSGRVRNHDASDIVGGSFGSGSGSSDSCGGDGDCGGD